MDKIIYKKITINDNIVLIVQALIDNQAKIIDRINGLSDEAFKNNLYMKEKTTLHEPSICDDVENEDK